MVKKPSKRAWKWIFAGLGVAIVAFIGVRYLIKRHNALPEGIASGNGRIEGKLVDVSAKEPLRVKEILVDEGALVKPGQVLVQAGHRHAGIGARRGQRRHPGRRGEAGGRPGRHRQEQERDRSRRRRGDAFEAAGGAGRGLATRAGRARRPSWRPPRRGSRRPRRCWQTATQNVEVARANAATIQTRIDDATLRSPVTGRVLYRLAEPGEVLAPGGKALTLVNLDDIYMEIFLPSEQAAAVKVGAEGRVTVDYLPKRAVAGQVSFVSPEAQFTPKQVETKSEREKLMFRVKIQLPKEVIGQYIERIKTGVRGVGYVKVKDSAVWPARLQNLVTAGPAVGRRWRESIRGRRSSRSRTSPTATRRWWRWTTSRSTSPPASWSASSAPTASASRR